MGHTNAMPNKFNLKEIVSLKKSDELYKIIANTGWLFADRISRMGLGLFIGVWVARYLGVQQFGLLSYATAFVGLFSTLSDLGLSSLAIKSIANQPGKKDVILGTIFWLKLYGGIVSLLLTVGFIFMFRQNDSLTIYLVAILASVGVFQSFDTIDLWFQSQVQSKYIVIVRNAAFILTAIAKIILIYIHAPLLAFAGAILAETILNSLGLISIYRIKKYSLGLWYWNLPLAKILLKESWPLIISGFTIMIYMKIDQIMLGEMLGIKEVGLYSSATRISEVLYFIPIAIASSVAPSIYAAKRDKNEFLYYQKIENLIRLLSLTAFVIALPMSFLSGTIITFLFGNEYVASGSILAVHIWASVFVFMGVGASYWFIAEGLTSLTFHRTLMGAITNIVLNFILIPIYGGIGAAIATVISQAFAAFLGNAIDLKTQKIFQIQLKSLLHI